MVRLIQLHHKPAPARPLEMAQQHRQSPTEQIISQMALRIKRRPRSRVLLISSSISRKLHQALFILTSSGSELTHCPYSGNRNAQPKAREFKTPDSFDFGPMGSNKSGFMFGSPTPNPGSRPTTTKIDLDEGSESDPVEIKEESPRKERRRNSVFPNPFTEKVVDLTNEDDEAVHEQTSADSANKSGNFDKKKDFSKDAWSEFWDTNPLYPTDFPTSATKQKGRRPRASPTPKKPTGARVGTSYERSASKDRDRNPTLEEVDDNSDEEYEAGWESPDSSPDEQRWMPNDRPKSNPEDRKIKTPSPKKTGSKADPTAASNGHFKMDDLKHTIPNEFTTETHDVTMDSPINPPLSPGERSEPTTPVDVQDTDLVSDIPFDRNAPVDPNFRSTPVQPPPTVIDYHNSAAIFNITSPVPPIVPSISAGDVELANYWQDVLRYQSQWNDYQLKMTLYFSERQQADQLNSLDIISQSGNLNDYVAVLQQDERVRASWNLALQIHKQVMVNLLGVRRLKEGW
ncbi:hypothetical protein BZA70DRAFT_205589 [Myxozyma melibiosi]|uniref:Extracellular mutant protein 11 C-terminal domain-containing protein n=1 Tax=Myxozyma melibiosi TaxID=54550 RepID=A0ABR1F2X4_9ASCO